MARAYPVLGLTLLPLLRSRIWTVSGREHLPKDGGYILVANHQSWLDSALVAASVYRRLHQPLRFVAQSSKWRMFGGLPIREGNRAQVLDAALTALEQGHPVVIFPEGNSNHEGELREGKTGAARLALRSGLPVIPIGIKGTRGVKAWRAALWFFALVRPCHVEIGAPIQFPKQEVNEHSEELLRQTTEKIMQTISTVSGKPMAGQGPSLGDRGVFWFIVWRLLRPLFQWRIRTQAADYLPRSGPFIIAGNHVSYFDAPTVAMATFHITGYQPMFLTKSGVVRSFQQLVGRGGVQAMGMLGLDDTDKSKVLGPAIEHLRRGGVIGIFPEGGRNMPHKNPNWQTELMKGKTGTARLAIATGAPVIPLYITVPRGFGIWETVGKALLPWIFLRVKFGEPIRFSIQPTSLETVTKDELHVMTKEVMTAIAALGHMTYPY